MIPMQSRKKIFQQIRVAQELFSEDEFTKAFNLLTTIERKVDHIHLRAKIANIKLQCLLQVGNVGAAKEYMEKVLTEYPLSGQVNFLAANLYHKLEANDRANRLFLRCVCLFPDNVHYSIVYSQFLRERSKNADAAGILKKCLRRNRKNYDRNCTHLYFLYLELAMLNYYGGNYWKALGLFNHCAGLQKEFPYHDLVAELFLKRRDYDSALEHLKIHFEQWGDSDPDAVYTYAKSLAGLNRREEALQALGKCRKLWGEVVITAGDITHLSSLMQDGSLKKIPDLVYQF